MMLARFRSCHLQRMQFAAHSQGSAPSFGPRHGQEGTESAPVHLPRLDRGERMFVAYAACGIGVEHARGCAIPLAESLSRFSFYSDTSVCRPLSVTSAANSVCVEL
jgi:hypothetical protein